MNSLRRFISILISIIRLLTIDLGKLLLLLLIWLVTSWRDLFKKPPSRFDGRTTPGYSDCVPMSHPAFKVPDPLIYSQEYLIGLGKGVTWDNPDIVLRKDGVDVPSSALEPDKDYEIVARIWNSSIDAPIVGLPVSFSYLAFGIGTQSFPITDPQQPALVTLGVKGGPNHPAFAAVKWRTPSAPGHYCIQVKLEPVTDANFGNNLGQENTQVVSPHSPAEFTFLLRNNTLQTATIRLETDTYVVPDLPVCRPNRKPNLDSTIHSRARYPVPSGWTVELNPSHLLMEPEQEQVVEVRIEPPPDFAGRQAFNINAFTEWGSLGGLTVYADLSEAIP